ncbi:MAG: hypothetical protein ACHP65_00115 [Legionellales bacterium]
MLVNNDLSVPGNPEIFVIADTAALDENGKPLPGVHGCLCISAP